MIETLKMGGVVMIPLLIGSIITLAVILERLFTLLSTERGGDAFRNRLGQLIRSGQLKEAQEWLRGLKGPVAAVARAAVDSWDKPTPVLEATMATAARRAVPPLERHLSVLETAITAAPLVGLLGTITGMMGVFRVVAQRLAHDPQADTSHVTAGIGEALVATAFGILIAVIAVLFYNSFRSWIDSLLDESELVAAEVMLLRDDK